LFNWVPDLNRKEVRPINHKDHHDCTLQHEEAFEKQMEAIIDAYMSWSFMYKSKDGTEQDLNISVGSGSVGIKIVDAFCKFQHT
jgi:hypothetical protein